MLTAYTGTRAVFAVLVLQLGSTISIRAQSTAFLGTFRAPNSEKSTGLSREDCASNPWKRESGLRIHGGRDDDLTPGPGREGSSVLEAWDAVCLQPPPAKSPRPRADNPCPQKADWLPAAQDGFPCGGQADPVFAELTALGKTGEKIEESREQVLDILSSENACAEWFATKDATPAATFQSLEYSIDHRGPQNIYESELTDSLFLFRQPYVARATQDGGAHTTITINFNGAFYRPQGNVQRLSREMGPVAWDGTRQLQVGNYRGDTAAARMVTLLHEFGHVIDLLPLDADNLDGKSVRNTDEVLRHCRFEVEARALQPKQMAKQ